ncbi:hypothetical protein BsWGS_12166 [Bradybaena similaris]
MMTTIGLPVFYLEAALGQFSSCGAMTCWQFAPLFKGLGIAMVAVSAITSVYYNMIIGWSLHYMFSSFTSDLPFASCDNKWNTPDCKLKLPVMTCEGVAKANDGRCLDENSKEIGLWNKTLFSETTGRILQSSSQEYWERFVLKFSSGIDKYGFPKWDLVLCLLLAWVICFLCLIKGIKTTGKVVYFTALFPYVVLIILLFRGVTLENASIGIKYFITPNFERLADASVWKDAANQVFFSMSIAGGGLITLSSYNRFHNNILRDSLIVAVGDSGTCILGGFVIFSYLGYMAGQLQVNIEDVAADGAGLAFVVYPEAVSNLPPPTLWAILFFIMLLTLGLDSQFAMVETVLTGVLDQYPQYRPRKTLVILVICIILFLFGLPLTCPGGMYLLQLMDNYVGGMTLIIIGFVEIVALVFIYGVNRFCQDIHLMTGSTWFLFWKVTWRVLSPLSIAFIFIFMFVDYKPSTYDKYTYPTWADVIGWLMTLGCVVAIPIVMVVKISSEKEGKNIWQKICLLCLPTVYWGPALKKYRLLVNYVEGFQVDPYKTLHAQTTFVNYAFDNSTEASLKSDNQASLGASRISIISAASKCTTATAKSGMTYESNV